VRVKTKRGIVGAGLRLHPPLLAHRRGPGVSYHLQHRDTLEGYKTIGKLATSRQHIVPGHDPDVVKIYPAAKPGLENWIVRLDEAPKT
jgi:hypothetical protein